MDAPRDQSGLTTIYRRKHWRQAGWWQERSGYTLFIHHQRGRDSTPTCASGWVGGAQVLAVATPRHGLQSGIPGPTADAVFQNTSHPAVRLMTMCHVVVREFMFRALQLAVPVLQWRVGVITGVWRECMIQRSPLHLSSTYPNVDSGLAYSVFSGMMLFHACNILLGGYVSGTLRMNGTHTPTYLIRYKLEILYS